MELINRLNEMENNIGIKEFKKSGLPVLKRLVLKLESDVKDKTVVFELIEKTINQFDVDKKQYKKEYANVLAVVKEEYGWVPEGEQLGAMLAIGIALGAGVGTAMSSINASFLSIGMGVGIAIGVALGKTKEDKMREEGKII